MKYATPAELDFESAFKIYNGLVAEFNSRGFAPEAKPVVHVPKKGYFYNHSSGKVIQIKETREVRMAVIRMQMRFAKHGLTVYVSHGGGFEISEKKGA